MDDRQEIRETIREKRHQLTIAQQTMAAQQASWQLVASEVFLQAQHIACYMAKDIEIGTEPTIEKIWEMGKNCYLPVLHPDKPNHLDFMPYNKDDELVENHFGIPEPIFDADKCIPPEELDLVIMPLLAFDRFGNRLGTGAGYFDRTFAFLKEEQTIEKPILYGLAYSFQELPLIKPEEWDVPLHGIITELKLIFLRSWHKSS